MTTEAYFEGHEGRECGEHRTVGSHRAWCHDCQEWCYPEDPCVRCERPVVQRRIEALEKDLAEARELLEMAAEYLSPWDVPRKQLRIKDFLNRTAPPTIPNGKS